MKIIKDLLEVYMHFIKLPLTFVNTNMNVEYMQDFDNVMKRMNKQNNHLVEINNFIDYIKSPTVVSVNDSAYVNKPHYVVTPLFAIGGGSYYILAGPFSIYPREQENEPFDYYTDIDIEELNLKMNKLYHFIRNKEKIETSPTKSEQYLIILNEIMAHKLSDYETLDYLELVLMQILRLKNMDFIGVGYNNANGIYEIVSIKGEGAKQLKGKCFNFDDGILGEIFEVNRPIIWHESSNKKGAAFFYRHNIVPKHLIALPVKRGNQLEGVLFGGNFSNHEFDKELIDFLEIILSNFDQNCIIEKSVMNEQRLIKIFNQMNEILNLKFHDNSSKTLIEKVIFNTLETITNGLNICYTSIYGETIYSQYTTNEIEHVHMARLFSEQDVTISYDGKYIYYYLENYGHYTIELQHSKEEEPFFAILNILYTIVHEYDIKKDAQGIFDTMYNNAKQLNTGNYLISRKVIRIIKKLRIHNLFNDDIIINLCKVMTYPIDYLEQSISETEELKILKDSLEFIQNPKNTNNFPHETRIFAYIYNKYILKQANLFSLEEPLEEIINQEMTLEEIINQEMTLDDVVMQSNTKIDLSVVIDELPLTIREKQVLHLIVKGLNNLEAAEVLSISIHTVKNHVTNILKKLDVADRVQLMAKVIQIQTKMMQ